MRFIFNELEKENQERRLDLSYRKAWLVAKMILRAE